MTENTTETEVKTETAAPQEKPLDKLNPLLSLDPIFLNKFGSKIKPHIKPIYYTLLVLIALSFISAFCSSNILVFFYCLIVDAIFFIVIRLFAELMAKE